MNDGKYGLGGPKFQRIDTGKLIKTPDYLFRDYIITVQSPDGSVIKKIEGCFNIVFNSDKLITLCDKNGTISMINIHDGYVFIDEINNKGGN